MSRLTSLLRPPCVAYPFIRTVKHVWATTLHCINKEREWEREDEEKKRRSKANRLGMPERRESHSAWLLRGTSIEHFAPYLRPFSYRLLSLGLVRGLLSSPWTTKKLRNCLATKQLSLTQAARIPGLISCASFFSLLRAISLGWSHFLLIHLKLKPLIGKVYLLTYDGSEAPLLQASKASRQTS